MTGKRLEPNPAGEYLTKWAASQSAQKARSTGMRYAKVIADFVESLGTNAATLDLRTVSQSKVQEFVDREMLAGKSGTTVILNAKILRAAFNTAVRSGIIERNPAGVLNLPSSASNQRAPFTPGDVRALLEAGAGTDWETAVMLGRHLGMRLGDACSLRWENVDFSKRIIRFKPQKTARRGKELRVPMTSALEKYLSALASRESAQGSQNLCPTLCTRGTGGRAGLSAEFMALMVKAGVDAAKVEGLGGAGRAFSTKSFHSLRHTIASDLANSNAPEKVARDILGHASAAMTDRYTHLHDSTVRKALEKSQRQTAAREVML
jgi:integrase